MLYNGRIQVQQAAWQLHAIIIALTMVHDVDTEALTCGSPHISAAWNCAVKCVEVVNRMQRYLHDLLCLVSASQLTVK